MNPCGWQNMTKAERMSYFRRLDGILLEHRYRYYMLDHPILQDFEYDFIERMYKHLVIELNIKSPTVMDLVDWNNGYPGANAAEVRVITGNTSYDKWRREMAPVWKRLGFPPSWKKIGWPA